MASDFVIPEGSPQDQASFILLHIEARALYAARQMRNALRMVLSGSKLETVDYDFDSMRALMVEPTAQINIHDFDSSTEAFQHLIIEDPKIKAALAYAIAEQYSFIRKDIPNLSRVLSLGDEAVKEAFQTLYNAPIESIYARSSPHDSRPFWLRMPHSMLKDMMPDLAVGLEWIQLPVGEILFNQGDPGDSIYTIVSGRIRISTYDEKGDEEVLAEQGRGTLFGEVAVLGKEESGRTATAYAIRDSQLVKLSGEGFQRLSAKQPQFGFMVTSKIVANLRRVISGEHQSSPLNMIVVMPASPDVPIEAFLENFERALSEIGSVFFLTSQRFDDELGAGISQMAQDDPRNNQVASWLIDLESAYRFVLIKTDHENNEWTNRCWRMADRIIIVANAGHDTKPTQFEKQLQASQICQVAVRQELVLLQPSRSCMPINTIAWRASRSFSRHHHVHLDSQRDFERLARRISGRAVGLALSGGGARGLAHIGVIRALQEANVPIDAVGGTSFGSIIGAFVGLEWDWQQISQALHEFVARRSRYFRPALPLISIMEGHRLSKVFQQYYGFVNLEDLWRPFFCLSSNLTRSRLEILDQGPMWSSVRASMSVPGVFPPVLRKGELLVDGGVMNNICSDIMKQQLEGGVVLGSNTSREVTERYEYENDISSWKLLITRANPVTKARNRPSLIGVITQTMGLASKWQRPTQVASSDLLFDIPVERYGLFEYDAIDELIEAGYRTAQQELEKWNDTAGGF
jgi:predicted acylesterase/phospholipase RssA/CRP-like cAMP-binding protein